MKYLALKTGSRPRLLFLASRLVSILQMMAVNIGRFVFCCNVIGGVAVKWHRFSSSSMPQASSRCLGILSSWLRVRLFNDRHQSTWMLLDIHRLQDRCVMLYMLCMPLPVCWSNELPIGASMQLESSADISSVKIWSIPENNPNNVYVKKTSGSCDQLAVLLEYFWKVSAGTSGSSLVGKGKRRSQDSITRGLSLFFVAAFT